MLVVVAAPAVVELEVVVVEEIRRQWLKVNTI